MNNSSTIFLSVASLAYIIMLLIVYFSKSRVHTSENNIFTKLLFVSFFSLLAEIYITLIPPDMSSFLFVISLKIYLLLCILWLSYFVEYVFIVTRNNHGKEMIDYQKIYKKEYVIFWMFTIIIIFLIIFLPIYFFNENGMKYSYGCSVNIVFSLSAIYTVIMLVYIIRNIKNLKNRGYAPIIFFVILLTIIGIIQKINPSLLLANTAFALVTTLLYYTIENPDIKTIKELTYSKEMLEKANNATMNSLNNLSLTIGSSLKKLFMFGNKKVDKSNIEEVIDETDNMKKIAVELVDQINGIIDLSKIESSKYELVKNNYNLYELVAQIRDLFNSKLGNKKIKIKDNIKDGMSNVLYGDSEKIKQAVIYLFNSLITNYNISNMEYRVFTLKVRSLCRLKISLILDYKEIKEYLENKNGKQIINLKGLDYKILEKLITLLHGSYDVIISNNKVAFTISIDQKDVLEYNNINNIKEEKRSKIDIFNASDKRVLIVDDNRNKIKEIVRMLTPYNIDVSVAHDYREYNDLLYSNKTWDLILLDDMMPDSKKFEYLDYNHLNNQVFERIEKIAGYKISVVVMLTPNKIGIEKRYENAKIDYILKPIDEVKLNKILKKYLLNNK